MSQISQFDGRSTAHIRRNTFSITGGTVHAFAFSTKGRYLAVGNDEGQLEFREAGGNWDLLRTYEADVAIRTICWHPTNESELFVGTANGNVYSIDINPDGEADIISYGEVAGYVHAIALNDDGFTLVIAYGSNIGVVHDPFPTNDDLGVLELLPPEVYPSSPDIARTPFIRAVQFIDSDTVVVTYLGAVGVKIFNVSSCLKIQDLAAPTQYEFYGTSALSPSGRRLAVANLGRGIDWFSFSHGRFMSTSNYPTQGRDAAILITNLAFVDEDTVVVGHCAGTLNFVSFGMSENPFTLPISTSPIQTLAFAKLEDDLDPVVVAIVPGRHHVPTTVTIVDVRLSILDSNLRRGLLVGMPGALHSTSPAVPTASPGLSVFNIKLTSIILVAAVAISVAQFGDFSLREHIPWLRDGCPPWKSNCDNSRVASPHLLGTRSRLRTELASSTRTVYATTTVTARPPSHTEVVTTTVTSRSPLRALTTTVTAQSPPSTEFVTFFNTAVTTTTVTVAVPTTTCHCATTQLQVTTTGTPDSHRSACLCTFAGTIAIDRASPVPIAFEVRQAIVDAGQEMVIYSQA